MYRRITLATVACALALPASALASEPAATGAGGVGVQPGSGLRVSSVRASRSGRTVTVKVRWDRSLIARKAERERFSVRLVSGQPGQRRLVASTSRRSPRGISETVHLRLNSRNARRVRSSSRVFAAVTQQFDSPDTDRFYELNHVAIAAMAGKKPFASAAASSCPSVIKPNTDMTGCQLPGSNLPGADLSGVNFTRANLEVSNLAGAVLKTTNFTSTDLTGALLTGASWSSSEQTALTFPSDGPGILDLIASAKTSVDVVIYDFGGPNLVGQSSKPGALMKAVQRGVNVRVIVNSSNGCDTPTDQGACAASTSKYDAYYAAQQSLAWASQHPTTSRPAGRYRIQFSSQNYQITHQKTILIDTADSKGNPLPADQMVTTSAVMVSTGNLRSEVYSGNTGYSWGDRIRNKQVVNPNYLTDPAASCLGGASGCSAEWAARDFAIKVTDPKLMERIAAVYAADQSCETWNQAPLYGKLRDSDLADTWANGTLLSDGTSYPQGGTAAFYGSGPNPELQPNPPGPQGNSRQRQIDLIESARESLVVYNEEMKDVDMVNALVDAAGRLPKGQVRVVMASDFDSAGNPTPTDNGPNDSPYFFSYLVANGVKVNFLPKDTDGVVYIHAKAIVADGTNAFMGSENFGYESMNYNRELGLMLTNSTDKAVGQTAPSVLSVGGVAAIMTAFEKDWNNPKAVAWKAYTPSPKPSWWSTYPAPPYPRSSYHKAYSGYNMACQVDPGGDLYLPALPVRPSPAPGS